MDRIKYATYNGDILPARLLSIMSDELVTRTINGVDRQVRQRVGFVVSMLPSGQVIGTTKDLAFVTPRFSTIEGLDIANGVAVSPETLTDQALKAQAERTRAATPQDGTKLALSPAK
jgi:hypothetical protein